MSIVSCASADTASSVRDVNIAGAWFLLEVIALNTVVGRALAVSDPEQYSDWIMSEKFCDRAACGSASTIPTDGCCV